MKRSGQDGVETLEFVAVMPLILMVIAFLWQGVVWLNERAEAETDARTLARIAVLCPADSTFPPLGAIDQGASDGTFAVDKEKSPLITVRVALPLHLLAGLDSRALPLPPLVASVTMRKEPC